MPALPSFRAILPFLVAAAAWAEEPPSHVAILPPAQPWDGASRSLAVAPEDPWATPCERSRFQETPRYEETVAWLRRVAASAPQVKLVSLGTSAQGREIWMAVVSKEGAGRPGELRANGRPTLLAQGGIHSGEIDGKDAGMMLLRDLTVRGTRRELLDRANFLLLPVLSVDAHERFGPYTRSNQRGPRQAGWRTNGRNLNLNRDYAKADSPEIRALLGALNTWDPDLYYDIHVTDGSDYQYDITWGSNGRHAHSPAANRWIEEVLTPACEEALRAGGHVPGPLVFAVDGDDLSQGNTQPTFGPRFSHGYGDLRHTPTVLVETHALKAYERRVLGTYVLLEATLQALGERGGALREAIASDRGRRPQRVPLAWKVPEGRPIRAPFLGVGTRRVKSPVTGADVVEWTGESVTLDIPVLVESEPALVAERPMAYFVPPDWGEVIDRLRVHGIAFRLLPDATEVEVEMLRLIEPKLAGEAFEGRVGVRARADAERRAWLFPRGTAVVPTDQPLGDLAIALLEPASADSFFQWGFFHEVLQRTEYIDAYVLEPMARRMLAGDEALRREFEGRLREDPAFAADPRARLDFFYRLTPFFDERWLLYPVGRQR